MGRIAPDEELMEPETICYTTFCRNLFVKKKELWNGRGWVISGQRERKRHLSGKQTTC